MYKDFNCLKSYKDELLLNLKLLSILHERQKNKKY